MTLAHEMSKKGYDVTLCEASDTIGGLTVSSNLGDFSWDKYYHVILLSDLFTRDLIHELGLTPKLNWVETKTGFYTNGKLVSMSNSIEFLKFPPLGFVGKFRLGFTIYYASRVKNWKKLEKIHVETWLRKLSGTQTFEKIWLPLLRAKLGEMYKKTSATFIWATIQRMYAARKSGLKKEMFGYASGGYSSILKAFYHKLTQHEVKIQTGHKLISITEKKDGNLRAFFEKQNPISFDKVILTMPSSIVAGLKLNLPQDELEKHKGLQYMGVICLAIVMKRAVSSFYVTNITDPGIPFTGVIEMSALVDKSEFKGNHLVYLPKYLAADDAYFDVADEEIRNTFLKSFFKMYPELNPSDVLHSSIARDRNVFVIPGIDHSEKLPPIKSALHNLYVLNAAHIVNGTLNVNETIKLATRSVDLIFPEKDGEKE